MLASIEASPEYAPAHLRLAEAYSELDDAVAAKDALLKALALIPDKSRLPEDERDRVEAWHALLTRNLQRPSSPTSGSSPGIPGMRASGWISAARRKRSR